MFALIAIGARTIPWPRDLDDHEFDNKHDARMIIRSHGDPYNEGNKKMRGQTLHLADWDFETGHAVACWDAYPNSCGDLEDWLPQCRAAVEHSNGTWEAMTPDFQGNKHYYHPGYFTPNGTIKIKNAFEHDWPFEGECIMEMGPDVYKWDCRSYFKGRYPSGLFKNLTDDQRKEFDDIDAQEQAQWKQLDYRGVTPVLSSELYEYFSTHPSAKDASAGSTFAVNGAALMHKHLSNNTVEDAKILHSVMSQILETATPAGNTLFKRLSEWNAASPDVVMHATLDAVLASTPEADRRRIEASGHDAIMKAVIPRVEAGNGGRADVYALNGVLIGFSGHYKACVCDCCTVLF